MSKHSPGPWKVDERRDWLVLSAGGKAVCSVPYQDESHADARLIAEAPAMLELLKKHEWSSYDSPNDPQACCPECGAYQSAMGTPRPGYGAHRTDCAWALLVARIEGEP